MDQSSQPKMISFSERWFRTIASKTISPYPSLLAFLLGAAFLLLGFAGVIDFRAASPAAPVLIAMSLWFFERCGANRIISQQERLISDLRQKLSNQPDARDGL